MADQQFCEDCFRGFKHEGTPIGTIETISDVEVYVSKPAGEYAKDRAVILASDACGFSLVNNKLLADAFAENGFQVYMPNILGDDTWPLDFTPPPNYDFRPFGSKHPLERSTEPINALIEALKERGVTRFAATGYCFGGKNVIEMAIAGQIVAGALNHPSRLNKPKDFERLLESGSTTKILINGCEFDAQFPLEAQKEADELLEVGKYEGGYKRVYWEGCAHGFAVRGDLSDPRVKAGMEGAFKEVVELFKSTL